MGRAVAQYLEPGQNLDDKRKGIKHNERIINIDGLLTSDVLITDIEDAMNHYDVRAEYSKQLGEALAQSADCAIINELANEAAVDAAHKDGNIPDAAGAAKGTGTAFQFVTGSDVNQTAAYGQKILEGLVAARAQFTKNYVPQGDRYCLLTPDGYSALIRALFPDSANYQAFWSGDGSKVQNVCGFEIIETPNLNNSGVDGKHALNTKIATAGLQGIVFHRSAVGTVKLRDLALERARRAEYQADQIIAKFAMGHGGLRPEAVGLFVKTAQAGG